MNGQLLMLLLFNSASIRIVFNWMNYLTESKQLILKVPCYTQVRIFIFQSWTLVEQPRMINYQKTL